MINTKREQIVTAAIARLAAGANVGAVKPAGELDASTIAGQLAQGKFVIEVFTTDDTRLTLPMQFEELRFELACVIHLPKIDGRTTASLAADAHGENIKQLTLPPANTLGNLADDVQLLGGGAAGLDPELGTGQGFSLFEVKYRHLVGDPTS